MILLRAGKAVYSQTRFQRNWGRKYLQHKILHYPFISTGNMNGSTCSIWRKKNILTKYSIDLDEL